MVLEDDSNDEDESTDGEEVIDENSAKYVRIPKQKKEEPLKDNVSNDEIYEIISKRAETVPLGNLITEKSLDIWHEQDHKMIIAALLEVGPIGSRKMKEMTKCSQTSYQVDAYIEAATRYSFREPVGKTNVRYEIPYETAIQVMENDDFFRPLRYRRKDYKLTNPEDRRLFDFLFKFGFCKLFDQDWLDKKRFKTRQDVIKYITSLYKEKKPGNEYVDNNIFVSDISNDEDVDQNDSGYYQSRARKPNPEKREIRKGYTDPEFRKPPPSPPPRPPPPPQVPVPVPILHPRLPRPPRPPRPQRTVNHAQSAPSLPSPPSPPPISIPSDDDDSFNVPKQEKNEPYKSHAVIRISYDQSKDTDNSISAQQFLLPRIQKRKKLADDEFDITKVQVDNQEEIEERKILKKMRNSEPDFLQEEREIVQFRRTTLHLPYKIGSNLTILDLGHVVDKPKFATKRYIYPVGYKSQRIFESVIDYRQREWYTSEILDDGNDAPLFRVSLKSNPSYSYEASSASNAWIQVMQVVEGNKKRNGETLRVIALSGPDYFGISNKTVRSAILSLPGAEKITITERDLVISKRKRDKDGMMQPITRNRTRKTVENTPKRQYAQKSVTQTYFQNTAPPPVPTLTFHFDSIMNEISDRERKASSEIQVDVECNEETIKSVLLNSNYVY